MSTSIPPPPFSSAIGLEPAAQGRHRARLGPDWIFGSKAHGGLLMVLLGRAGVAAVAPDGPAHPLSVTAEFLYAPDQGPVELRTEVLKRGRTASVVAARLYQDGRIALAGSVTVGVVPPEPPRWAEPGDLADLPAEPPGDATDLGDLGSSRWCDQLLDTSTAAFLRGGTADPVLRGWVRPHGEPSDEWFALLAGDLLPPTVLNLTGRPDWAPTVHMTTLVRGRPVPGWLRMQARSSRVDGAWFDEDVTVIDAAGQVVSQTRKLSLCPRHR